MEHTETTCATNPEVTAPKALPTPCHAHGFSPPVTFCKRVKEIEGTSELIMDTPSLLQQRGQGHEEKGLGQHQPESSPVSLHIFSVIISELDGP